MEEIKGALAINNELNLYLVVNSVKPATMISLSSLNSSLDTRVSKSEELREKVRHVTLRMNSEVVDELRSYLEGTETEYKDWKQENVSESWDSQGNKTKHQTCYDHMFYVGSNKECLERLLSAKSDREIGLALGFPNESVEAYQKVIDGERRDGSYVSVSLARAKQAGIELPTWLAYICFVPENLDLVNGNISPSSQILAEKYQNFVRKNNPDLARRVEQNFLDRKLPDSWEKTPDGGYSCCYKF